MVPEALVLDYGEVLVRPQSHASLQKMAAIAGLPLDEFVARYWRHRHAYDRGLPAPEYWRLVVDGTPLTPTSSIADLISADAESWMAYREDVWSIASAFRQRGGRTAILSNGVPEIISRVRRDRPLEQYFDAVIVSCEVGCAKPAPEIYRICVDALGVPAAKALFVDDRVENLRAAESEGLRTLYFTGDESIASLRQAVEL